MGGVLLIDEAYYLYNAANDRDYGQESIEILLNVMEQNTEDLIVVLAGACFFFCNVFVRRSLLRDWIMAKHRNPVLV